MNQQPLFDPTFATTCPHCGTTDPAACEHDSEQRDGAPVKRRPRGCIAGYDPRTAAVPY